MAVVRTIGASGDITGLTADAAPDRAADYLASYDDSVGTNKKVLVQNVGPISCELVNKTVNFTSDMTAATMQALIDACGKYIGPGATLTFQFGDGTYTIASTLTWTQFLGPGIVSIFGNRGEANADDLHTTQSVYIDHGAANGTVIAVSLCALLVQVYNLEIRTKSDSAWTDIAIQGSRCQNMDIRYNWCIGTATTKGYGIFVADTPTVHAQENYITRFNFGIGVQNATMFSYVNDDTVTSPLYGLAARYAGTIGKGSTQPAGSTANEFVELGGIIRA